MKSRFRFHLCCVCMLALAIAGCKVKRPDDVISESKMENLLYDYHLAKSMGDNLPYRIIRRLCISMPFSKNTVQRKLYSIRLWCGTHATRRYYRKFMKR